MAGGARSDRGALRARQGHQHRTEHEWPHAAVQARDVHERLQADPGADVANPGSAGAFFFEAEDGIRDIGVTGVQTCALPIWLDSWVAGLPVSKEFGADPTNQRYDEPL